MFVLRLANTNTLVPRLGRANGTLHKQLPGIVRICEGHYKLRDEIIGYSKVTFGESSNVKFVQLRSNASRFVARLCSEKVTPKSLTLRISSEHEAQAGLC